MKKPSPSAPPSAGSETVVVPVFFCHFLVSSVRFFGGSSAVVFSRRTNSSGSLCRASQSNLRDCASMKRRCVVGSSSPATSSTSPAALLFELGFLPPLSSQSDPFLSGSYCGPVQMIQLWLDGRSFKSVGGRFKEIYLKMKTIENWRKTVLLACVVALAIDPLFLFIPVIDSQRFCLTFDKKLGVAVCVLRTIIDTFYMFHIIFHLITEVISPRSQKSVRGELTETKVLIRKKRHFLYFIVDICSVLPIPQVVVLIVIQQSASLVFKKIIKWIILFQYLPRIIRIYPLFKKVTRAFGMVTESKWIGAIINFFLYMLSSYVFGAFWYVSALEKKRNCWQDACDRTSGCNLTDLFCTRGGGDNSRFLKTACPLIDPGEIANSTVFNFGMFIDALKSGVVEAKPRDFTRKFVYCFWWGLRNISALGQNLETSNSSGEILFAIIICVSGLLLFAVLIGNAQKYLQSSTTRVDEMEDKRREVERWMSYRKMPDYLRERMRKHRDYKWRETRGTEEEGLIRDYPKHLRNDILRHLCLDLLKRVPCLQAMDDRSLDILCSRLKPALYTKNSYILREGEPVEEILFKQRGELISTTTDGVEVGAVRLLDGEAWGKELFHWAFEPQSSQFPISRRTVQARTEVEGFVLSVDDLKSVATQCGPEIKRNLYLDTLKRVHMFRIMEDWLLEDVCDRVKYVSYSANSYIMKEGGPVEEMLIVTIGKLKSSTEYHEIGQNSNYFYLRAGDVCGELLFNGTRFPTSTRTVMTLTDVEGFILLPDDVNFVVSQLNGFQKWKLKETYRFYSLQWRSWAAFHIQAEWRKYCKRKLSMILPAEVDDQNIPQGTQLNLASTLYESRFVSKSVDYSSFPDISPLVPHKPPDFEFGTDEV